MLGELFPTRVTAIKPKFTPGAVPKKPYFRSGQEAEKKAWEEQEAKRKDDEKKALQLATDKAEEETKNYLKQFNERSQNLWNILLQPTVIASSQYALNLLDQPIPDRKELETEMKEDSSPIMKFLGIVTARFFSWVQKNCMGKRKER